MLRGWESLINNGRVRLYFWTKGFPRSERALSSSISVITSSSSSRDILFSFPLYCVEKIVTLSLMEYITK